MYSDIILQTFDAFQAQQDKAQHVTKDNTHHRSQQRQRLLSLSGLGHSLSIRSLSSCRPQHGERGIDNLGTAKVGRASWDPCCRLDVGNESSTKTAERGTRKEHRQSNILINNAGKPSSKSCHSNIKESYALTSNTNIIGIALVQITLLFASSEAHQTLKTSAIIGKHSTCASLHLS